ncbi:MAG: ShlB/FhaC/HecB family hemolysin secretion/activation protein [Cyanobacteria bacterium J06635_15]
MLKLFRDLICPTQALAVSLVFWVTPAVHAQFPPLDTEPQRIPDPPLDPPELPSEPPPELDIPEPPTTPEFTPIERSVYVSEFRFLGNTVFSDAELTAIAEPYTNRNVSFAELLELRSQITNLYVERGYTTSGAFIPIEENQNLDVDAASIAIQILEGQVEELQVLGDSRLETYVRARVERAISPVLNQPGLEEALRLLQSDPLIQSISANLSAGSQPNLSALTVQVSGQPPFALQAGIDNSRSPSIGTLQVDSQLQAANLLSLGEIFSAEYTHTDGSDQIDLEFSLPVNLDNGTIAVRYSNLDTQIVEAPFDQFDIDIDSRIYELTYRQPILRRADSSQLEELTLGITASRLESESTIEGFPFPLSAGADEEGRTRVSELSLFQEYRRQMNRSALLARSEFSVGLDLLGATVNESGPDGRYLLWRGQLAWLQALGTSQLLVRGEAQLSTDSLVPLNQFSLGGTDTIRGYRQGALVTDNGVLGIVELRVPLLGQEENTRLDLIPFFAAGVGWNHDSDSAIDNNVLVAPGLGLQFEAGDFQARLNYAVPLTDVSFEGDSFQEEGFDFRLQYRTRF